MAMTRSRESAATRTIRRFEDALIAQRNENDVYNSLVGKVCATGVLAAAHKRKATAERRYNMLRGSIWRALVASSEEL